MSTGQDSALVSLVGRMMAGHLIGGARLAYSLIVDDGSRAEALEIIYARSQDRAEGKGRNYLINQDLCALMAILNDRHLSEALRLYLTGIGYNGIGPYASEVWMPLLCSLPPKWREPVLLWAATELHTRKQGTFEYLYQMPDTHPIALLSDENLPAAAVLAYNIARDRVSGWPCPPLISLMGVVATRMSSPQREDLLEKIANEQIRRGARFSSATRYARLIGGERGLAFLKPFLLRETADGDPNLLWMAFESAPLFSRESKTLRRELIEAHKQARVKDGAPDMLTWYNSGRQQLEEIAHGTHYDLSTRYDEKSAMGLAALGYGLHRRSSYCAGRIQGLVCRVGSECRDESDRVLRLKFDPAPLLFIENDTDRREAFELLVGAARENHCADVALKAAVLAADGDVPSTDTLYSIGNYVKLVDPIG